MSLWTCSHEAYHANRDIWGHSMLEVARESMVAAHNVFIAKEGQIPTSEPLEFGGMLHCLLLEPGSFDARFAVIPPTVGLDKNGRQTAATKEFKEWAEEAKRSGRKVVKTPDFEAACRMRDAILAEPELRSAFEIDHRTEQGIRWVDEETGLPLKCKPDYMREASDVLLDLKFVGRPDRINVVSLNDDALSRLIHGRGYHRQIAHYSNGYQALTGRYPKLFLLVFVSRHLGHEVAMVRLDPASIDQGHAERRLDYRNVAAALERAEKEGAAAWRSANRKTRIRTLSLPKYAVREETDEEAA